MTISNSGALDGKVGKVVEVDLITSKYGVVISTDVQVDEKYLIEKGDAR